MMHARYLIRVGPHPHALPSEKITTEVTEDTENQNTKLFLSLCGPLDLRGALDH